MAQVSGEMFATGAPPVIAKIKGEAFTERPRDLYIPPDALTLFLQSFEGPFDLLLYLIRRQRLDLNEISVAQVTDQYMVYVEEIRRHNMQLASDYPRWQRNWPRLKVGFCYRDKKSSTLPKMTRRQEFLLKSRLTKKFGSRRVFLPRFLNSVATSGSQISIRKHKPSRPKYSPRNWRAFGQLI